MLKFRRVSIYFLNLIESFKGSSCIYALILCKLNKNWKMLVSDIDNVNIDYANKNVIENKMSGQIIGKNLVFG